jgi:hypothetical protein
MGGELSTENMSEIVDSLDTIVWESNNTILQSQVDRVFRTCGVFNKKHVNQVLSSLKMKEAKEKEKARAFRKNSVTHMDEFHTKISYRYGHMIEIIKLY